MIIIIGTRQLNQIIHKHYYFWYEREKNNTAPTYIAQMESQKTSYFVFDFFFLSSSYAKHWEAISKSGHVPQTTEIGIDVFTTSLTEQGDVTPLYHSFLWAPFLNFTFRVKYLQRRNSNWKKEKGASCCKQDSPWSRGKPQWEAWSQNRVLLLAGKAQAKDLESGLLPSPQ